MVRGRMGDDIIGTAQWMPNQSRSGGMVDAPVSKTGGGNPVSVRLRPSAPITYVPLFAC
jgi:hypothetical protein